MTTTDVTKIDCDMAGLRFEVEFADRNYPVLPPIVELRTRYPNGWHDTWQLSADEARQLGSALQSSAARVARQEKALMTKKYTI